MAVNDDKKGASGAADDTSVTDDGEGQGAGGADDQKVSHKTYQKTLSEAKSAKERARIAEEKLAQAEQDKLQAEGKKDELIAKLKETATKAEKTKNDLFKNFAKAKLSEQVKILALEAGCIDANAVMKLGDFGDVEIDSETFLADEDVLKERIAALKKSNAYLFSKPGPRINTKLPNGKIENEEKPPVDLNSKTPEELYAMLKKLNKK